MHQRFGEDTKLLEKDTKRALEPFGDFSQQEQAIDELVGKLSSAEWKLKEQQSLQTREEEYKALNVEERSKINAADARLQSLNSELETEQTRYDDISRRGADKDRELQNLASRLNNSVEKLRLAEQAIHEYHNNGGDEQLERCQQEIEAAAFKCRSLTWFPICLQAFDKVLGRTLQR